MKKLFLILALLLLAISACNGDEAEDNDDSPATPPIAATEDVSVPTATEEAASTQSPEAEATEDASSTSGTVLVVGDISDDPADSLEELQPLVQYLEAHLEGVTDVSAKIAPDMETMIAWMEAGEVDLYFDSLYPALIISDQANAQPILRRWKDEVEQYRTVIFALKDSGFSSLEDLNGHTIAFDENVSTSGYMLPLWMLLEAGVHVSEIASPTAPVAADQVGYVFSGDDENTLQWIISGRADAGAIDDLTFAEIPPETQEQLVILAESEYIPRQVVIVAGDLSPAFVDALITVLTGMDEDPDAAEALDKFDTSQFDEFPQGADAAITRMREIYTAVQATQQE